MSSSVQQKEIENFAKDSAHWWDESGPFKPLHKLNPARMRYIKAQICAHFERDYNDLKALKKLKVLDVGCGGGLVCEPLSRLGANVSGLDADAQAIAVAQEHAKDNGLKITYQNEAVENHKGTYDVVTALEILEHVADVESFIRSCADRLKPGGLIIFSTLNRTPQSFALGIVAAEYILRWVPRGTHNWKQFIKPSELARAARSCNLTPADVTGLVYNPTSDSFSLSDNTSVNYLMTCRRA